MSLVGMDIEAVRDVGRRIRAQASALEGAVRALDDVVGVAASHWNGPDVAQFTDRWNGQHKRGALLALHHLNDLADDLARNADDQQRTSATLEGASVTGGASPGGGLAATNEHNKGAGDLTPLDGDVPVSDADLAPENIRQGAIGDCWLLSALGGVSNVNPQFIRDHIVHNPDGSYTVTMYDLHRTWPWEQGTFTEAKVSIPAEYFANGVKNSGGDPSWASVYEAAAAIHRGGSADDIWGAQVGEGLELVTGRHATTQNDPTLASIQQGLKDGRMYEVASNTDIGWWPFDGSPDQLVVPNHAYMIDAVEQRDGQLKIHLLNPWGSASGAAGKAEDLWLTEKEFHDNYSDVASVAGK